jgi:hypothetical protein
MEVKRDVLFNSGRKRWGRGALAPASLQNQIWECDVQTQELQMGSRRQQVAGVRAGIARQLVNELGTQREGADHLRLHSISVSRILRAKDKMLIK